MRKAGSRWRRRRASYRFFIAGLGLLGFFLIVAGLWPGDWAWIFAVAGFAGFVFLTRQSLALWNLDRLVFDRKFPAGEATTSGRAASIGPSREGRLEAQEPRVLSWQARRSFSTDHRGVG